MIVDCVICIEMGPSLDRSSMLEALGRGKVRLTLRRAEFFMFKCELSSFSLVSIEPPPVYGIIYIFILGTFLVAKAKLTFCLPPGG